MQHRIGFPLFSNLQGLYRDPSTSFHLLTQDVTTTCITLSLPLISSEPPQVPFPFTDIKIPPPPLLLWEVNSFELTTSLSYCLECMANDGLSSGGLPWCGHLEALSHELKMLSQKLERHCIPGTCSARNQKGTVLQAEPLHQPDTHHLWPSSKWERSQLPPHLCHSHLGFSAVCS